MSVSWTMAPADVREFPATCRGCSKPIRRLNTPKELWEDAAGITVCMKAPLAPAGEVPDYVFHQPMPHGLIGAPL